MTKQPGTLACLTIAALLVAVVGCSSTKGDHGSAPPPGSSRGDGATAPAATHSAQGPATACDLLTVDEVKTATGLMADAGKSEDEDSSSCTWVIHSTEAGRSTVSVDAYDVSLYPGLAPGATVPVSGVGDEALWAAGLWTLYVHSGQRAFSVQVALLSVKQQPIAQALALNVLAHLS